MPSNEADNARAIIQGVQTLLAVSEERAEKLSIALSDIERIKKERDVAIATAKYVEGVNTELKARLDKCEAGKPVEGKPAETLVTGTAFKAIHLDSGIRTRQEIEWNMPGRQRVRGGFNSAFVPTKQGETVTCEGENEKPKTWKVSSVASVNLKPIAPGIDLATVLKPGAAIALDGEYVLSTPINAAGLTIVGKAETVIRYTGPHRGENSKGKGYTHSVFSGANCAYHNFSIYSGKTYDPLGDFKVEKEQIAKLFEVRDDTTIVGVKAHDFGVFALLNSFPKRVLIQGCEGVGLRTYFAIGGGEQVCIYDNVCRNTIFEHIVRIIPNDDETVYAATLLTIDGNEFANADNRATDPNDDAKGVIVLQSAQYAYVSHNEIDGPWGVGPLSTRDGGSPNARSDTVVVVGNTATHPLDLHVGAGNVLLIDTPHVRKPAKSGDVRVIGDVEERAI